MVGKELAQVAKASLTFASSPLGWGRGMFSGFILCSVEIYFRQWHMGKDDGNEQYQCAKNRVGHYDIAAAFCAKEELADDKGGKERP